MGVGREIIDGAQAWRASEQREMEMEVGEGNGSEEREYDKSSSG